MKYVKVCIDNKSQNTDLLYTYGCEKNQIRVGEKVLVPFGQGDKLRQAYVFQVSDQSEKKYKNLKYVESIDPDICLTEEIINTCIWMRRRYLCKYIDAIKCFTPAGSKSKQGKKRIPFSDNEDEAQNIKALTSEQQEALKPIQKAIAIKEHKRFLLHGITGSGKTEVYKRAIERCLGQDRKAIMLVPEISLTKQMIDRFAGRFGLENIAVLHSKLSPGQRYDEWVRIRSGEVSIVIGARSAVFAPLQNIGVIILDEEHEGTYKSDMAPKYDTVEVAIKRLMSHKGVLLLGSATPGITTYHRAKEGIYQILELRKRYNQIPLPKVKIADMKEEAKGGNISTIGKELHQAMSRTLKSGRQIILFLNRRGYATVLSCRACGLVVKCPDCGISLTYHKDNNMAACHYCGRQEKPKRICDQCGSRQIRHFGAGTEKVQEAVQALFPEATIARLDLDAVGRKGELNKILNDFRKGNTQILIGTQLVAKGLDFHNVGLVGIVMADVTLNIPDFRSPERAFQLITQAAGRSGRGDTEGSVVIQTYTPENYAILLAAKQDYKAFYQMEIALRKAMEYPPFSDLIQLVFFSKEEESAKLAAEDWYEVLQEKLEPAETKNIFLPGPAPLNKIKETYRYCLLLKCPKGKRKLYSKALADLREEEKGKKQNHTVVIDFNPYTFM